MKFDEDEFRTVRDRKYSVVKSWLREAAQRLCLNRLVTKLSNVSLLNLSVSERKLIHKYWIQQRAAQLKNLLLHVLEFYRDIKVELEKCYQKLNLRCLLRAHVIDVTITDLIRNLKILRSVRAKVMMCEETDEILKTHTLIALLSSVEHAILIGNHEQLRSQINNYELQHDHFRDGKFSLNISLFERLVKPQLDYSSIRYTTPFDVLSAVRESRETVSIRASDRAKIHARRNVQFRFQTSSCLVNTYGNGWSVTKRKLRKLYHVESKSKWSCQIASIE